MQFYDFKEIEERVIRSVSQTEPGRGCCASLDELEELAATAGAVTVGKVSRTVKQYTLELISAKAR